jgi:hypothetical protein
MSRVLSDVEIAGLIKRFTPLVKRTARTIWLGAGAPDGIQPEDLFNAGRRAVLEAEAEHADHGRGIDLEAFVSIRVNSRQRDELRQLRTGVRTTEPVARPDGSFGFFTYAFSADVQMLDDPFGFEEDNQREKIPRGMKQLQKRIQRLGETGFADGLAARLDFKQAYESIPDRADQALIWLLQVVQMPTGEDPKLAGMDRAWRRFKTPYRVTLWLAEWLMPRSEAKARLKRAGTWINAYCEGRPLKRYPSL